MSGEEIAAYARREAERQAQQLRQQAELERPWLEYEDAMSPVEAPVKTSLGGVIDTGF